MSKPKILVIVGTTRQGRVGRKVADWFMSEAQKTDLVDLELLDIADYNLPVFDEPVSPMAHKYSELQNKLAEKVGPADGFIFVTGEYNHSVPGSLKNFIDYLNAEWAYKVAGFVGYGGVGGVRSMEHLVQIMSELRAASIRESVKINAIWEALDDNGVPKDGYWFGDIPVMLKELAWWANALKAAREADKA